LSAVPEEEGGAVGGLVDEGAKVNGLPDG